MNTVCGFGVNDVNYQVQIKESVVSSTGKEGQRLIWICPFYLVWKNMISRAYSGKYKEKYPTYTGSSVCQEWKYLSTFKSWMETQDWEGKQLDKDLLVPGNKIYSSEACIFVTCAVNSFILEKQTLTNGLPTGVSWCKISSKFKARCRNPFIRKEEYLGLFTSSDEAHQAWLKRKLELAKLLAAEQDDPRVARALIERYENYGSN